ncbi:hypothetical protein [Streptomyces osmaniensis]|uniref:Uncharacterized protein n=1 Tax=Streptomyces osmaniensis TaxID=593134 RepID=A0ABP6Z1K9_9ACTN|nr:hypothetical protein KJK32_45375 [Streptomyces sp. JCM17656]
MTQPTEPRLSSPSFPEGHPLHAPALTAKDAESALQRLERSQREALERRSRAERAASSAEARAVKDVVEGDGNVPWPEFVKHCGGILEVVALVDEQGRPDTDQIIPKVDALFEQLFPPQEYKGGMTMTRKPQNRPYVPGHGTAQAALKRAQAGMDKDIADAEELLRREQEAARRVPTTGRR